MPQWERIAGTDELAEGARKSVIIDETPALLLRIQGVYYCIEDVCTHDGQPLTEGPVAEGQITCPRHGARFDLKTGVPTRMPATEPIRIFEVEVRDDGIYACGE
jgi:3-phenylpropionate/trans-cinnamate dioxygenase ferredoxin subunit